MSRSFAKYITDAETDFEAKDYEKQHQKYMDRSEEGKFSWPPWIQEDDKYILSYSGVKPSQAFYNCPYIERILTDFCKYCDLLCDEELDYDQDYGQDDDEY